MNTEGFSNNDNSNGKANGGESPISKPLPKNRIRQPGPKKLKKVKGVGSDDFNDKEVASGASKVWGGKKGGGGGGDSDSDDGNGSDSDNEKDPLPMSSSVGAKRNKNRKNNNTPRLDYASTVKSNYEDLNQLLGKEGIENLTKDTKELLKQQTELAKAMQGIAPLMNNASELLRNFKTMDGIKGMGSVF